MKKRLFLGAFYDYCCKVCWAFLALGFFKSGLSFAPEDGKGTASSAYGGLGLALGNNGFNVIGALFLSQFRLGFIVFGIFTFAGVLIATLIVHEPSNLDETSTKKKEKFSLKNVKLIFPSWQIGATTT